MLADIIFDLILIAILVCGAFLGYKIGFIKTVCRPLKGLLALLLAFFTAAPIGKLVVSPMISEPIVGHLSSFLYERCADINAANAQEKLPTLVKMAAGICGIDIESILAGADNATVIERIVSAVAEPFVSIIAAIIAFIVLLFVYKLLMGLIINVINNILDRGIVGLVNKISGCVITFALSFFVVWGICAIFEGILNLPYFVDSEFAREFSGGIVYKFFKLINPIDLLLSF